MSIDDRPVRAVAVFLGCGVAGPVGLAGVALGYGLRAPFVPAEHSIPPERSRGLYGR